MDQVGIDEFLCALRSLGVKKDDLSGEPLKIKYSNVALYSTYQRYSTPTKYENEEEDDDKTKYGRQVISIEFIKTRKHYF